MAPSFLSKLVHSRDRSDPSGRTPSPNSSSISGRSRALSSSTSIPTSEFGTLNGNGHPTGSKTNLAVKTQPHSRVPSSERDNNSDSSSFINPNFTIVPPSPSMHAQDGLPAAGNGGSGNAPEVDGLPDRSITSSPASAAEKPRPRSKSSPSSSPRSLPNTATTNSPRSAPPVPPLPPMKNDKLASPQMEVRKISSNKSLKNLVTPSVNHSRAATAPAFTEVDDMTPIVESPTSEFPGRSALFSDDTTPTPTPHANGNYTSSFLASPPRDSDAVSIRSTKNSPPSDKKSNKPWRRAASSKPTGLASAIAASGLTMANPSFTANNLPQISPPAVTRTGTVASSRKASLSSNSGAPYMLHAGSTSGGASSSSQFSPPRSSKSRRSSIGSGGRRTRNGRAHRPSLSMHSDNGSEYIPDASNLDYYSGLEDDSDEDEDDDDDSSAEADADDVDLALGLGRGGVGSDMGHDMGLPQVTGFAVASSRRNTDFHELFRSIPEGDYLIEDYGCALQREILIQGRLYISENHICFHANILGWITDVIIPIDEIISLEKKMTAFVIPNAILITTRQAKYNFASFLSRDTTFDVIYNIWRLVRPDIGGFLGLNTGGSSVVTSDSGGGSGGPSAGGGIVEETTVAGSSSGEVQNKVTQCRCGKDGLEKHFPEIAMNTVIPGSPEKIHNLMFTSGFIKDFLVGDQKLIDLQMSDWSPNSPNPNPNLLNRTMSYIKPLTGRVGPAQTKCEIRDEISYCDFSQSVSTLTTTRTPDVPSGGSFSVKTRTCITFASGISSRVVVTTEVQWTGRSLLKGVINSSAIDGQKTYHAALEKAMRAYIQQHQTEFVPEGVTLDVVVAPPTDLGGVNGSAADGNPSSASGGDAVAGEDSGKQIGFRGLQWAWETFEGTWGVAKKSTKGALELLGDIIPAPSGISLGGVASAFSSPLVLYAIILGLVASNVWTWMRVGKVEREKLGLVGGKQMVLNNQNGNPKAEERGEREDRERWIQGVVTALWDEMAAGKGPPSPPLPLPRRGDGSFENVVDEVGALYKTLDDIEQRARGIRQMLDGLGKGDQRSSILVEEGTKLDEVD